MERTSETPPPSPLKNCPNFDKSFPLKFFTSTPSCCCHFVPVSLSLLSAQKRPPNVSCSKLLGSQEAVIFIMLLREQHRCMSHSKTRKQVSSLVHDEDWGVCTVLLLRDTEQTSSGGSFATFLPWTLCGGLYWSPPLRLYCATIIILLKKTKKQTGTQSLVGKMFHLGQRLMETLRNKFSRHHQIWVWHPLHNKATQILLKMHRINPKSKCGSLNLW